MKILYIARLFSGLESSFISKKWNPSGVPTIYKMIERIDKNYETKFIFTSKDTDTNHKSKWNFKDDKQIKIRGLINEAHVLSGVKYFYSFLPFKIKKILREIRQTLSILRSTSKFNPDLIYIDHSNILVAAILATFYRKIVVLRLMGIYPFMREVINNFSIKNFIFRLAYSAPYKFVICTQDGSGVENWLSRALSKKVPYKALVNGVEKKFNRNKKPHKALSQLPKNKIIVTFVGKLERYKGCEVFVRALLDSQIIEKNCFHGLILGTGSIQNFLIKEIKNSGLTKKFTFIERLPHNQIYQAHAKTNIYVSLNQYGNLSNANLEAINYGSCMIILRPDYENSIDVFTKKILNNSVISISRKETQNELVKKLLYLHKKKNLIKKLKKNTKSISKKKLVNWDQRIKQETDIFKKLALV